MSDERVLSCADILQAQPGAAMSIEIPVGLTELLQGFTVEVLRQRPSDLVDFAVQYFTRLRDAKSQDGAGAGGKAGKGVMFDGEPMQTESNGEDDEDDDSDFERKSALVGLHMEDVCGWRTGPLSTPPCVRVGLLGLPLWVGWNYPQLIQQRHLT